MSFVLVLAVHIPHVGVSVNGARRWIGPGSLQFQPSELLKLALVLYAATLLARRPRRVHDLRALINPLLLVVGAACLLVGTQPDLGSAMVIAVHDRGAAGRGRDPAAQAGARRRRRCWRSSFSTRSCGPYARARLTSFMDPWAHASGSGFQAVQGQIAIGSGGLFGVGPGQSVQKIFYLPEAPTDFILAVIAEELGVVGVCALLFLYGLIAYAGLRAAKAARSLLQRPDRGRHHRADRLPGGPQRVRRARSRAADGRSAAVRLLRLEQPDRDARGDGAPAQRRSRRDRARACGGAGARALGRRPWA